MTVTSSRREFLKKIALGASAVLVSSLPACAQKPAGTTSAFTPTSPSPNPSPTNVSNLSDTTETAPNQTATLPKDMTKTESPTPPASNTTSSIPDLVVIRHGNPEEMVIKALAALGGIESFVKAGITVVIKPNICNAYHSYEYASTTNPWVVGALVKLCLGAGASKVKVLDYPFGGDSKQAYSMSGIAEQVSANGGEMVPISRFKFKDTSLPQAVDLKSCAIFDDILNADLLINVPIAKNHGSSRLTFRHEKSHGCDSRPSGGAFQPRSKNC